MNKETFSAYVNEKRLNAIRDSMRSLNITSIGKDSKEILHYIKTCMQLSLYNLNNCKSHLT